MNSLLSEHRLGFWSLYRDDGSKPGNPTVKRMNKNKTSGSCTQSQTQVEILPVGNSPKTTTTITYISVSVRIARIDRHFWKWYSIPLIPGWIVTFWIFVFCLSVLHGVIMTKKLSLRIFFICLSFLMVFHTHRKSERPCETYFFIRHFLLKDSSAVAGNAWTHFWGWQMPFG